MSFYAKPFPWHYPTWEQLYRMAKSEHLHHGLLIEGAVGSGKTAFAQSFAQLILCKEPRPTEGSTIEACQDCDACCWVKNNTHPNLYRLTPEEEGVNKSYIAVQEIRDLIQRLQQTAVTQSGKQGIVGYHTVVIIDPVGSLSPVASNALLKTLEEPIAGVLFLLINTPLYPLLSTIKSRCAVRALPKPDHEVALQWIRQKLTNPLETKIIDRCLYLANGVPSRALYECRDGFEKYLNILNNFLELGLNKRSAVEVTQAWGAFAIDDLLRYLMLGIADLIEYKLLLKKEELHQSIRQKTEQYAKITSTQYLFSYLDLLNKIKADIALFPLNTQILIEKLAYVASNSASFV